MTLGLRVDVDTFRGTEVGVPALRRLFGERGLRATFFFSVGPDNMGRHLWRLRRPAFLWKMLRSGAAGLYGWDIVLRGTLWPGPRIGERLPHVIRAIADDGHEIGFHAWDHQAWQARLDSWDERTIRRQVQQGVDCLTGILGRPPAGSAAPGWRCDDRVLAVNRQFSFAYGSDCRGHSVFAPRVAGLAGDALPCQVPVTLPTYDELVGRDGLTGAEYYRKLLTLLDPQALNVLALHAEVEGIRRLAEFGRFLDAARSAGWEFARLVQLAAETPQPPPGRIEKGTVPGREGWVACQGAAA